MMEPISSIAVDWGIGRQAPQERTRMDLPGIIVALVIGGIAGWLAGVIVKGAGFGVVGNVIIGIVGAFVASLLFPRLGLTLGGSLNATLSSIIYATLGAVIVLIVLSLIRRAA